MGLSKKYSVKINELRRNKYQIIWFIHVKKNDNQGIFARRTGQETCLIFEHLYPLKSTNKLHINFSTFTSN